MSHYVLIAQWTTLHSRHCARHKACALLFLLTTVLRSALAPAKGGEKRGSLKGLQRVTGSSDTRVMGNRVPDVGGFSVFSPPRTWEQEMFTPALCFPKK